MYFRSCYFLGHSLNFISVDQDLVSRMSVARDTGGDKVITAIIITPCTYLGICGCESSSMYIPEDAKERKQHAAEGQKSEAGMVPESDLRGPGKVCSV